MSYVGEQRRQRAGGRRRRSSFSVPQSSGEVQETREQRKKTMVWGKKEKFYPHRPIYTSPGKGRGGGSAPLLRPFLR
jgi:hypothetical protein